MDLVASTADAGVAAGVAAGDAEAAAAGWPQMAGVVSGVVVGVAGEDVVVFFVRETGAYLSVIVAAVYLGVYFGAVGDAVVVFFVWETGVVVDMYLDSVISISLLYGRIRTLTVTDSVGLDHPANDKLFWPCEVQ